MPASQELDRKQFFQPVVETISLTLRLPASIWLVDETGEALRIAAATELPDDYIRKAVLRLNEPSVASDVFATGQTIVVPEIASDDRWKYKSEITAVGLKSAMVTPLRVKDKIVGVLNVYIHEVREFSDSEKALIESFASQVAVTQRRIRDLTLLNEVSLLINSELHPSDLFKRITQSAAQVLDCQHVSIFQVDKSGDLVLETSSSEGVARTRFASGEGLAGWVTQTGQSELVPDAVNHPRFVAGLSSELTERSMLLVPITTARNEVVGVISADKDGLEGFDEHDQALLETLASQAAIAVRNVRLYEREVRTLSRLKGLIDATQSVSALRTGIEPKEALKRIVEEAREVLDADLSVVFPYDEQADRFIMDQLVAAGEGATTFEWQVPREKGATRRILEQGELIATNLQDASEEWASLLGSGGFKDHFQVQAIAGAPLRVGTEKVGVLYVNYQTLYTFDEEERSLIEAFANTAAIILHNARLYEQASERADTLVTVSEVGRELVSLEASPGELEPLLQRVAENAQRVLGADVVTLYQYIQARDEFLVPPVQVGELDRPIGPVVEVFEDDVVVKIVRGGSPLYSPDAQGTPQLSGPFEIVRDKRPKERFVVREGIVSSAAIPLKAGAEIVGVMFVNYRSPQPFTEVQREAIESFANQAAVAIRGELERLLQQVAKKAQEVLEADVVTLYQYIQARDEFIVPPVQVGELREPDVPKDKVFADDVVFKILQRGGPLYSADAQSVPEFSGPFEIVRDKLPKERFVVREGIVSSAAVPLKAGAEIVGVMFVNYRSPRPFTDDQRGSIELFANQAAVAIRNARLFDSTLRSAMDLENLLDITRDVTSVMADARLTLQTIIERAVRLIGTTRGAILLYHDGFGTVEAGHSFDPAAPVSIGAEFPTNIGLQIRIKEGREPVQIEDVTTTPFLAKSERKQFMEDGIKSALIVPMVVKGEVIGSIGLDETRSSRSFTPREVELGQIIAGQAAIAIENARLFERTSERLEITLKQREQLLSLVREIDEWIAQRGGEKAELAEFTLNRFLDLFRFETAWILLLEGQELVVVATDPQHVADKGRVLRLDGSITGLAAIRKQSVIIEDIEAAEPYLRRLYQPVHGGGMRSELAVPMTVEDRVVGVLNLESNEPAAFTSDDQELLETLARHLGVAIVAAEEMQQRAALSEMAIEFSGSLEEEETAKLILNRALKLIGGQFGQILTREGEKLEVKWATGGQGVGVPVRVDDCASGLALLPPSDPYLKSLVESGAVILSGRSVIIPHVDRVERYKRVIEVGKERMQSELAVPVICDGEVVGVFNVESPELDAFTGEKEAALAKFVQKHADEIGQALHQRAVDKLEELMQQGLDIVDEEFGQILSLDGIELVIEHTEGDEPPGTRVAIRTLQSGQLAPVTGRAVMERTIVNVPDVSKDPGYVRFLGEEMKSELVVPLIVRGEAIGVINLESPVPGYFTEEHVDLLEPMASHAASATASARAARDRELAAVGEKSGDIVHRLSNPAGAIRWRLERLRKMRGDLLDSDDYLMRSLADIERNALKIQDMVRELRESTVEPLAPFKVWLLLTSALGRIEVPENIEVIASPDDRLPRVLSTRKLEDVFYNLMTNAVEAMTDGGDLEITAEVKEQDWVEVSIRDTGRGIPEYLLEEIFRADFTTKGEEGHGLGLWWSKAFVEKCDGTFRVQSEVGKGSCFMVRLPVAR